MNIKKQCKMCYHIRDDYHRDASKPDGLSIYCVKCEAKRVKVYRQRRKQQIPVVVPIEPSRPAPNCKTIKDVEILGKSDRYITYRLSDDDKRVRLPIGPGIRIVNRNGVYSILVRDAG